MKIKISKQIAEEINEDDLREVGIEWNSRSYEDYFTLDLSELSLEQITKFQSSLSVLVTNNVKGVKIIVHDIDTWIKALSNAGQQRPRTVSHFCSLLKEYLRNTTGHRIYQRADLEGNALLAYYVNEIEYHPEQRSGGGYTPAYVDMDLLYIHFAGRVKQRITFQSEDISGNTAAESLAKAGYFIELPEYRNAYLQEVKKFNEVAPLIGKQYLATGYGTTIYSHGDYYSRYDSGKYILDKTKVVIDVFDESTKESSKKEYAINKRFWNAEYKPTKTHFTDDDLGEISESNEPIEIPVHPYCAVFDLRRHLRLRVHINYLTEYIYDKSMNKYLILPKITKDLVATLIEQSKSGFSDIIEGKGMGIGILLGGQPGVGKTLTAEVFAEASERPLYSIQAAQLGIDSKRVEENLNAFLARGSRWNAIVLIDEADVYIRARDTDMEHNAIVASILRVLEYQTSILFMTTNLANQVDDAIISRCIARINYHVPDKDEQYKIWETLAGLNNIQLTSGTIHEIVERHSNLVGRDIKQLLKLAVLQTAKSKAKITPPVIDFVAQFQPTIRDNGKVSKLEE